MKDERETGGGAKLENENDESSIGIQLEARVLDLLQDTNRIQRWWLNALVRSIVSPLWRYHFSDYRSSLLFLAMRPM